MGRSPGFGSASRDSSPYSDSLSLRLPYSVNLATERNSLTHYAKGTRSPPKGLPLFVRIRFQDLFHSPPGVLFAFPSRYWCTIGRQRVLSLGGWSPHLQTGLHVSRPTRPRYHGLFVYATVTLFGRPFQTVPLKPPYLTGLFRGRSPLLAESRLISFPPGTEMFQFPGFAPLAR